MSPCTEPTKGEKNEVDRIRAQYILRDLHTLDARRQLLDPFGVLTTSERRWACLNALRRRLSNRGAETLTALDIGCGSGSSLLWFIEFGFDPQNVVGVELSDSRAARSRLCLPSSVRVIQGNAGTVGLPLSGFDIVHQATVFTSILDDSLQKKLARRMWELVRPGGMMIWYDFIYDNPRNSGVRGVPIRKIRELFPEGRMRVRRMTVAPPIGRPAARVSKTLYGALAALQIFCSHAFVTVEKDPNGQDY